VSAHETSERAGGRRGRALLAAAAVVVVAGLVVLGLLLTEGGAPTAAASGSTGPPPAAAPTTSAAASTAAASGTVAPAPGAATGTPVPADQLPPALPAVALTSPAAEPDGVAATLTRVEGMDSTATGPGEVAGPAVRVAVQLRNGSAQPVTLSTVGVSMSYGAQDTPASPLDDPTAQPFRGTLAPGATASAVYVFSVPADQRGAVTVEVDCRPGAPLLRFTGPVG
jgi:hypothetical protein